MPSDQHIDTPEDAENPPGHRCAPGAVCTPLQPAVFALLSAGLQFRPFMCVCPNAPLLSVVARSPRNGCRQLRPSSTQFPPGRFIPLRRLSQRANYRHISPRRGNSPQLMAIRPPWRRGRRRSCRQTCRQITLNISSVSRRPIIPDSITSPLHLPHPVFEQRILSPLAATVLGLPGTHRPYTPLASLHQ